MHKPKHTTLVVLLALTLALAGLLALPRCGCTPQERASI